MLHVVEDVILHPEPPLGMKTASPTPHLLREVAEDTLSYQLYLGIVSIEEMSYSMSFLPAAVSKYWSTWRNKNLMTVILTWNNSEELPQTQNSL